MKTIKKVLCLILIVLMFTSATAPVMASDNIKVRLGGELIKFDVQPQLINERTMVPLRAIFEALGATVDWNGDTQTVTSTKGDTTIKLTINDPTMHVNDGTVTLDSPACLVDGRTLVPVRAISEAFKLKVEWDGANKTVIIKKEVSLISEKNDSYAQTLYTYADDGKLLEKKVSLKNNSTVNIYKYEYENEKLSFVSDTNGYWERYSYNEQKSETFITCSDGTWQRLTYDAKGHLIKDEYSPNEYSEGLWYTYEYNDKGVCINIKSNSQPNGFTVEYDERGNKISEKPVDKDDRFFSWYKYEYDMNNNLIYETYGYDGDAENANWKKYEYDNDGNLIFESDSYGSWKKYEYDNDGNLVFISDNHGSYEKYIVMEI